LTGWSAFAPDAVSADASGDAGRVFVNNHVHERGFGREARGNYELAQDAMPWNQL